jgi:hypothetical protein
MNVLKHASHIQHILDRLPKSTVWALHGDNVSGFSLEIICKEIHEAERIANLVGLYRHEDYPGGIEMRINPVLTVTVTYGKEEHERPARKAFVPSQQAWVEPRNSRSGNPRREDGGLD